MKKNEFIDRLNFNHWTGFVYDSPSNRYVYSDGELDWDSFDDAPEDGYTIEEINNLPKVKEVMMENFLGDLKPSDGTYDEVYENLKERFEAGDAKIGWWRDGDEITYILIL